VKQFAKNVQQERVVSIVLPILWTAKLVNTVWLEMARASLVLLVSRPFEVNDA